MTKKIAIFVEGYTEEEFLLIFLEELIGANNFEYEIQRQSSSSLQTVQVSAKKANANLFLLIVNCCSETAIVSQINDQYSSLLRAGYKRIIGLRDVYPIPKADSTRLLNLIKQQLPKDPKKVELHFAYREIESWFIQEVTHYERIDDKLTSAKVTSAGFDPFSAVNDVEEIEHPAGHLNKIYQLVGKSYKKKQKSRNRTLKALSVEEIYVNVRLKVKSLNLFLTDIETAIFSN